MPAGEPVPTLCGVPFRGARWRREWLEPGLSRVYTVNAEFLYWALRLPRFLEALRRGDCTADGRWVALLLNLKYRGRVAEHLPGSRMIHRILRLAGDRGLLVAFVGETPPVLRAAAEEAERRYGARVVWHAPGVVPREPWPGHPEVEAIAGFIEREGPDIVLVALGPPKQEILIDILSPVLERAGARLAMGVGGSLRMLAGLEKMAPRVVSRLGLEWLWRLAQDPRRRWVKVARSLRALLCAVPEALAGARR